ncbi:uncharacterized protein CANTADRAFT_33744, partial [Suhomyces tanzawaensis NRRL Y-17324]
DTVSDFTTTIDSYINKSPITSKFREDNPNLRPVDDASSTSTMAESTERRTLDLGYTGKRLVNKLSYYSTQPVSEYLGERLPSPSIELMEAQNDQASRDSRLGYATNRFSLSSSLSRLSMSQSSHSHVYKPEASEPRSSMASEVSMMSTDNDFMTNQTNPFWKYHILKFGKDMYLTTNPGIKHMYCRNGPGFYVETIFPDKLKKPKIGKGFTLIFKDINGIEANKKDNRPPIMIITKKAESEGGYFTISIPKANKSSSSSNSRSSRKSPMYNGLLLPKKISPNFIPPYSNISQQALHEFNNYEFKDFNNCKWNVGSIPRVRSSRMNKIKSRLRKTSSTSTLNSGINTDQYNDHMKFIGKKNIYFHQNYLEEGDHKNPMNLLYRDTSGDPSKIYLHESNGDFPPVLGLFRPYESKARKRLMNSLQKNRNIFQNRNSTSISTSATKISRNSLSYDLAGGDVKNYYRGGDGLYYLSNPSDDTPDDNKLGWITIYEDKNLFSGDHNKGMFEIVVGLTLAVGFESCME